MLPPPSSHNTNSPSLRLIPDGITALAQQNGLGQLLLLYPARIPLNTLVGGIALIVLSIILFIFERFVLQIGGADLFQNFAIGIIGVIALMIQVFRHQGQHVFLFEHGMIAYTHGAPVAIRWDLIDVNRSFVNETRIVLRMKNDLQVRLIATVDAFADLQARVKQSLTQQTQGPAQAGTSASYPLLSTTLPMRQTPLTRQAVSGVCLIGSGLVLFGIGCFVPGPSLIVTFHGHTVASVVPSIWHNLVQGHWDKSVILVIPLLAVIVTSIAIVNSRQHWWLFVVLGSALYQFLTIVEDLYIELRFHATPPFQIIPSNEWYFLTGLSAIILGIFIASLPWITMASPIIQRNRRTWLAVALCLGGLGLGVFALLLPFMTGEHTTSTLFQVMRDEVVGNIALWAISSMGVLAVLSVLVGLFRAPARLLQLILAGGGMGVIIVGIATYFVPSPQAQADQILLIGCFLWSSGAFLVGTQLASSL